MLHYRHSQIRNGKFTKIQTKYLKNNMRGKCVCVCMYTLSDDHPTKQTISNLLTFKMKTHL